MATRFLTRSLLNTGGRRALVSSSPFRRFFCSSHSIAKPQCSPSTFSLLAPSIAVSTDIRHSSPPPPPRPFPRYEQLEGCDFEHWQVVFRSFDDGVTRDEIIDTYIKTLAMVVGSEDEAKMKIYSVSTNTFAGYWFGVLASEELALKILKLPGVRIVCPHSYLIPEEKQYGGEPFINGQAVPFDPKYHCPWGGVKRNKRTSDVARRMKMKSRNPNQEEYAQNSVSQGAVLSVGCEVPPPSNTSGPSNMGGGRNASS